MSTNNIAGTHYGQAPVMSQAQIDVQEPQAGDRSRYRLVGPGTITIGKTTVTGSQVSGAVASQLVWLSAATAAGFGNLIELAP